MSDDLAKEIMDEVLGVVPARSVEPALIPTDNTPLGDRMKRYEHTFRQRLPRRAYTLMRLDGKAFHTYLRKAKKPFDETFMRHMDTVALTLCKEIQGARFAYTQSDEISVLITDFESTRSEPYLDGVVAKLTSIPAALASAMMMNLRYEAGGWPLFDCRVWSMSDPVEVANYFVWRQRDWVRNSIQMAGQAYFSHAELHEKSVGEIQDMLFTQYDVNWNDYPDGCKRGRLIRRNAPGVWGVFPAPSFQSAPSSVLADLIPALPSLRE